jgi:signal transduction histidine kinase/ActR/RegA family two-component response regulator
MTAIPGRRISIGVLVTVSLVAAATTLLTAFGLFSYRTIRAQQWDDLQTTHRIIADSLAVALVLPVWNFDHDQIDRIFQGTMQNRDVAAVVIRLDDRHGTVQGLARDAQGRIHAANLSHAPSGFLRESRGITTGTTQLGTVDVFVTPAFLEAQLRRTRYSMVGVVLALDAMLIFVPGFLLWRLVLRPLKHIEMCAAAVTSGHRQDASLGGKRFRGEPERLRASVESMMVELLAVNERYARYETALATLTRSYPSRPDDLPAVLQRITETVTDALDVTRVSIWRLADDRSAMTSDETFDRRTRTHSSGAAVSAEDSPAFFRALAEEDSAVPMDPPRETRSIPATGNYARSLGIDTFMFTPIRAEGVMVGLLICGHAGGPRTWKPDEQTFAVAVANMISALRALVERQGVEAQLRQAQKLEAIGQLAGGVAHDFNNVLMVILGKASQIAQDSRVPADLRSAASDIRGSGERAASLTRQLLAFSRRQAMQTRVMDLNATVRNTARMLQRLLGADVAVRLVLQPEAALVLADPGMVDQVLLNLAVNARDAMAGGGQLTIETSSLDAGDGRFVCLRVSDTGTGIAPEHLPHIFEPFFTTKDVGRGTGLGLATTYGIVQQHGGRIEVDSEPGRGTAFRVLLPAASGQPADEAPVETPVVPLGTETILVVEDEEDVRDLVVESLTGFGYNVVEASSAPRALEVWQTRRHEIDLLVTDLVMPDGMTGFDLARRMRADRPALKVIYTSGYVADMTGSDVALSEGVNYLAKPFSLPALARLVRRSLDSLADAPHQA